MAKLEIDITTEQERLLREAAHRAGVSLNDLAVRRLLNAPVAADAPDDSYVRSALDLYRDQLQSKLEPQFNGQIVAIHPESGEHLVEKFSGRALRSMRKLRPTGKIVLHTIGPVTDSDLVTRIRGERPA